MSFTPDYPCQNVSCRSFGHPHPNCRCNQSEGYAEGGIVHHCSANNTHDSRCEYFAEGGDVESNHEFAQNPDRAIDNAVLHNGLHHTLTRTGFSKSPDPMKAHQEFLDAHRHGRKALQSHASSLLEDKHTHHKHDSNRTKALETTLNELRNNPDRALNIGGDLGDTLPVHHSALAAKAGTAMSYLESIKPLPSQAGPLDAVIPPTLSAKKRYERQVAIIEDPRLIFEHVKRGDATPQDFQTMSAVYPKLRQGISDRAFEMLASIKASGKDLTYKQKKYFGALIGQPISILQSPIVIASIINANRPPMPAAPQKPIKKASDTELRQINKMNELYKTPLEKLQTNKS